MALDRQPGWFLVSGICRLLLACVRGCRFSTTSTSPQNQPLTPKAGHFELAADIPVADIPAVQENAHLIAETATRRLTLIAEANGMWRFVEDSHYEGDEFTGPYFAPTHRSGLYESADAAERDARAMLPWLRDC